MDEAGGEGEAGLRAGSPRSPRYAGKPRDRARPRAGGDGGPLPDPAVVLRGHRGGLPHGPHHVRRYATFADLRAYCERVASAVGLASIEIFGYDDPGTRDYAMRAGPRPPVTNILRDVAADAGRDRLYLPLEDLARFEVPEDALLAAARDPRVTRPPGLGLLLAFEADRARSHYAAAASALAERDRRSMLAAEIMSAIYRAVLEEWVRRGRPVGAPRGPARQAAQDPAGAAGDPADVLGPVKVAVVGGGFAGFAAAVALQERRHEVVLLERRGVLGERGRPPATRSPARTWTTGPTSCSGPTPRPSISSAGPGSSDLVVFEDNLKLEWADEKGTTALDCPPLGAPLHLLAGLLGLRVPLSVKLQAVRMGLTVRFGRRPVGLTLAEYFRRCGQGEAAGRLLWDPLALAVLNEPVERAAAVLFHRLYQEAFLRDNRASRLAFLRRGWGVLAERLARYLEGRGGTVRRGARVEAILVEGARATGVRYARRAETREEVAEGRPPEARVEAADAVVSAVPAHALGGLLPEEWRTREPFAALERFSSSPIVSVEIWLDRVVVDRPMLGLRDSEVEWVFDKGRLHGREGAPQHLAFVVSAAYRSAPKPNAELVAATGALGRHFPAMAAASVQRALVLREPLATFASSPELEALRPEPDTPIPGLFLAGDWTNTGLPATIEGAVRSGQRAAQHSWTKPPPSPTCPWPKKVRDS